VEIPEDLRMYRGLLLSYSSFKCIFHTESIWPNSPNEQD